MLRKLAAILIGSLLFSIGINLFLIPHELLDGGVIGLALILHYVFELRPGLMIILISLPIYAYAWRYQRTLFFNSLHGLIISSWCVDVLSPLRAWGTYPIFSSAVLGGLLVGCGIGLMLLHDTSTGGTDLIALFVSEKYGWNVGILIFMIDAVVIAGGAFAIGAERTLYTLIAITNVGLATSLFTWQRVSLKNRTA
jgi:uncharacterized membrane-anchored protein YitT (DUF2179 family)